MPAITKLWTCHAVVCIVFCTVKESVILDVPADYGLVDDVPPSFDDEYGIDVHSGPDEVIGDRSGGKGKNAMIQLSQAHLSTLTSLEPR